MITEAQFDTIEALFAWGIWEGVEFTAEEVFPRRDNADNGHRRTLRTLAHKGLLRQIGNTSRYIVPSKSALDDVAQEYNRKYNVWD